MCCCSGGVSGHAYIPCLRWYCLWLVIADLPGSPKKTPSVSFYKNMVVNNSSFVELKNVPAPQTFPLPSLSLLHPPSILSAVLLFSITIVGKMAWSMNKMAYYWQHAAGVIFQLKKKSLLGIWKNCLVYARLWQCYQAASLFHRRQQSLVAGGRTIV